MLFRSPDDDHLWEIYSTGLDLLADHGYKRYEISAYSKPGFQSRHNLNYWQFGDYLGIGAGAHGKLSDPSSGVILRSRKFKQPEHYLHNTVNRAAERVEIKPEDRALEFKNGKKMIRKIRICKFFNIIVLFDFFIFKSY